MIKYWDLSKLFFFLLFRRKGVQHLVVAMAQSQTIEANA